MGKAMQARLQEIAAEDGVSMNHLVVSLLAGAIHFDRPPTQQEAPAPGSEAGGQTQQEDVPDEQKAD
jgi:hypothetical protein